MVTDVTFFWMIHLFVGILLPVMVYFGCCREEQPPQNAQSVRHNQ
jgi:hypothetical protein